MSDSSNEALFKLCRDVLAPLVRADGGELYVVHVEPGAVHLHLGGVCGGCPGSTITRDAILAPAVRGLMPKAALRVTTGYLVPDGASKM